MHFNSHAHVERDLNAVLADTLPSYFNSHAHVERDCSQVCMLDKSTISTHTLTWSVTKPNGIAGKKFIISTHTLTWSVTGRAQKAAP